MAKRPMKKQTSVQTDSERPPQRKRSPGATADRGASGRVTAREVGRTTGRKRGGTRD